MTEYFIHPYTQKALDQSHLQEFLQSQPLKRNMENGKVCKDDEETLENILFIFNEGFPEGFDIKMNKPKPKEGYNRLSYDPFPDNSNNISDWKSFDKQSIKGDSKFENPTKNPTPNLTQKPYSVPDYMNSFSKLPDSFFKTIRDDAISFIKTAAYYSDPNFKKISSN